MRGHINQVRDVARGFDRLKDVCMSNSDELTWAYRSVESIIRQHVCYDKNNDAIVLVYRRGWRACSFSIAMGKLGDATRARRALAKLEARDIGTPNVVEAVKQAYEIVLTGGDGIRVIELPPSTWVDKRGRR